MRTFITIISFLLASAGVTFACGSGPLAPNCDWDYTEQLSDPDTDSGSDSGSDWAWAEDSVTTWMLIQGGMTGTIGYGQISLSESGSGNGKVTIFCIQHCFNPAEDLESTARNGFTAAAALDDDNNVQAVGRMRITGGGLDCDSNGGVSLSNTQLEEGQESGVIEAEFYGIEIGIHWAMSAADEIERTFQDNDQATGATSPETYTGQTNLTLDINIQSNNVANDSGSADIKDPMAELVVWGTCDGTCDIERIVYQFSSGY